MATDTSFFADTSGTTVAYVEPAASPYSDYSYLHGYDYYNAYDYYNEHFDSIVGSIHDFDATMTPAAGSSSNSNSSSNSPHPQQ
ncbi:hypothetical protein BGZ96_006178 [Linnemannia gamsii]|uniref:Uncharacterized protein n=1 Tax=Linnemannia gamsii TaxID=64522 RepID=A0ABQ7K559_9FUNG|nr:hypothetical protein BGZ96_006178 [Linnemannia gamsii]